MFCTTFQGQLLCTLILIDHLLVPQASALEELTVRRGEKVEVLDDSRNWWHVKNKLGATGYVPLNMMEVVVKKQKNSAVNGK